MNRVGNVEERHGIVLRAWALLGRNGVGKTTLLSTVMGLTELRAGRITFAGEDITALDTHRRAQKGLGLVPQER